VTNGVVVASGRQLDWTAARLLLITTVMSNQLWATRTGESDDEVSVDSVEAVDGMCLPRGAHAGP